MTALTLAQYGFEDSIALYVFVTGFCGLLLLAAVLVRVSLLHWLLGAALLFASLAPSVLGDRSDYVHTWLFEIQLHRAELHLAMGVLMSLIVIFSGGAHLNQAPAACWFLLGIGMYSGLLQFKHDTPMEGAKSLAFFAATIPGTVFAASSASSSYESCLKTLRTVMWVSILWTFACSVQFVIQPRFLLTYQGRFLGMLGNPQHAAVLVAPFAVIALWLILNDPKRRLKLLWIALLAINLLFLGWTGSRTGFLMLLLGTTVVLYRRMGQTVLLLPLGGLMLWGLSFLAEELEIGSNLERLVSTENTRVGLVDSVARAFGDNPWIGVGWTETGWSENSYLVGLASYGIGMFGLMVGFLGYMVGKCFRYTTRRSRLPAHMRPVVDIYVAFFAMYFAAAAFEGYLLGRSSSPQVMALIFGGMGVWIDRAMRGEVEQHQQHPHQAHHEVVEHAEPAEELAEHAAYAGGYDRTEQRIA